MAQAGGGRRTGARPTDGSGEYGTVRVHGEQLTAKNIHDIGTNVVYTTAFVNLRFALAVLDRSLDFVPYKSGELYMSAVIGDAGQDFTEFGDPFGGKLNPEESVFRQVGHSGIIAGEMIGSVKVKVGATARTFSKYYVGYTADHAAIVHETPASYNQGTGPRGTRGPKGDHYLLRAYQEMEGKFSAAHHAAFLAVEAIAAERGAAIRRQVTGSLSAGTGKPRLVKRPR